MALIDNNPARNPATKHPYYWTAQTLSSVRPVFSAVTPRADIPYTTRGATLLGDGAPAASLGTNLDTYIDVAGSAYYRKSLDSWVQQT